MRACVSIIVVGSMLLSAQFVFAIQDAQLVGLWRGDGLDIRVESVRSGAIAGSIDRGGQKFTMTGKLATGGALQGSFVANGSQFQFTGDLNGNTLTFRTGSTTYRLSKQQQNVTPPPSPPNAVRRVLPQGYKSREDPQGGTILVADRVRAASGPNMIRNALTDLNPSFDSPPQLTTGFTDTRTGHTQGMFISKLNNRLIDGIVVATPEANGGKLGIVYDYADRFAKSRPRLMKQLLAEIPAMDAAPATELRDTRLPDGSGNIKLPAGWNIVSANQGTVEAHGPNGEGVVLGVALPISIPSGFGNAPFVLPYTTPENAIVAITPSLNAAAQRTGGPMHDNIRVLESQRTEYSGGQAAFMVWQGDEIAGGRRTRQTTFGLVITAPVGPGAWMFYVSGVYAPTERFAESFPSMLQSWQSWKINDRVFTERLRKTAETMAKTTEILQSSNRTQEKAFDKANGAWDEYLGGTATVMDARTGKPVQMSLTGNKPLDPNGNPDPNAQTQNLNQWIDEQNRLAGTNRFQALKPGDNGGP